ncbi:SusC/RagA family TonB-linked outer membrane protein [Belliella kenyensis]|uniref:SusC/RagA family TonB-linked outer membrane protein n=1 Tax=Belliella kenyensis TaxID=1472724 RepID=A0ABV8EPR5_9BACT|nr:TonB-dependent receptor [Belliella kenyensis]MCH7402049.1 TonB-dependent receptor [Belliella kenyensis]MDN3605213.1 TonB-dependent receptor [Belliella kenyensis]
MNKNLHRRYSTTIGRITGVMMVSLLLSLPNRTEANNANVHSIAEESTSTVDFNILNDFANGISSKEERKSVTSDKSNEKTDTKILSNSGKIVGNEKTALGLPRTNSNLSILTNASINLKIAQITGVVTDARDGLPIPGVTVLVKGTTRGVATGIDGEYSINVEPGDVLVFSFIGYKSREIVIGQSNTVYNISLNEDETSLDEIVVVGYAEQKRETVVGSVVQTKGEVLQRAGGVSNVGQALTGNLPGVITTSSVGIPGQEMPQIVIRGQNSWNGNSPLILVDGVERPEFFNQMDIASVESISVLKDASATAVFGSRGANGVIIVTTKRGREGKAEISANFSSTVKSVSKLPGKMDSYDAIGVRNQAIERELSLSPNSWAEMIPEEMRRKYRYPANLEEMERYPNVNWQDVVFKDQAMAYNANVAIRGGTDFVKYFSSIDYQHEGDLFREFETGRGYQAGFNFDRINFRSNLDFQLTPTTKLGVNLGGSYGVRQQPWSYNFPEGYWNSVYRSPPDAFLPRYSDGSYGTYIPDDYAVTNSLLNLAISGTNKITTTMLSTNFVLEQDLGMVLKGLNFRGTLAVDNSFQEDNRGINDLYNNPNTKWINPLTGEAIFRNILDGNTRFDFVEAITWNHAAGTVNNNQSQRRLFYQMQLNYAKSIDGIHNFSAMGLLSRQEDARGSIIPSYREDWVFRAAYDYKSKYLIEYNGAYNGSEKFSVENRFAFFSSGGLGWNISEENFMKDLSFIDVLKVRGSYGEVGDDNIGGRFLFMDEWLFNGNSQMGVIGESGENSPFTWFRQNAIGNPNVKWETVYKYNFGTEFRFLRGLIHGSVDWFKDNRVDILMTTGRSVPSYYGANAPAANLGRVETTGYELMVGFNRTLNSGVRVWGDFAMTHAIDQVIKRDDPFLRPDYQKQAGFQLGQYRSHISAGFYNTWDELYGSPQHNTNDLAKLPGNYFIADFNGDGVVDDFDSAPYGFSGVPQNTYNTNLGIEWKGLSLFVQFYGVNNVTRDVALGSLNNGLNLVYDEGEYWTKDNPNADSPLPRWRSQPSNFNYGPRYLFDGSYLRLKNAEIAYNFKPEVVRSFGMGNMRVYVNGNNLLLWTKMPDDRESNFGGPSWQGAYPTIRRINLGLNVTF